jgi:hypothetical protein
METLLTESMISSFSIFLASTGKLLQEALFWKLFSETAGEFPPNGTQLELIEYHAKC